MDPFELLKKDHEIVSQLFKQIESASGKTKLKGFKRLKSELDLHTHIEEVIFYPAIENAKETRAITLEAYEEHKVVKELLAELDSSRLPMDEWTAKFTVLQENVEHHVDEEEGELFNKASDVLTGEQADDLGDRMAAEKRKRGGKVDDSVAKTKEKPGLIQTIASALGLGDSKKSSKKSGKKPAKAATKATKAKPASARGHKSGASGKASTKSKAGGKKAAAPKATAARKSTRKK